MHENNLTAEDVGIVVIAWRRWNLLSLLLNRIKSYANLPVFIYIDGPKKEDKSISQVAATIAECRVFQESYDFGCTINERLVNIGCYSNVTRALNEVALTKKYMIVLEEDCLPSRTFFNFCLNRLDEYVSDERILQISGTRFLNKTNTTELTVSRFAHTWGWATWADRWQLYEQTLVVMNQPGFVEDCNFDGLTRASMNTLKGKLRTLVDGDLHTWDYQWLLTGLLHKKYTILPPCNTVKNIGSGDSALHTKILPRYLQPEAEDFATDSSIIEDWSFEYDKTYTRVIFDSDWKARLRRRFR